MEQKGSLNNRGACEGLKSRASGVAASGGAACFLTTQSHELFIAH